MPTGDLPLPTLLSQLLLAFTIEFDNEFEHRAPHRTTSGGTGGRRRGLWLVSQPMWANFMQFVGEGGLPLHDVSDLAGLTNLAGLERWGYVVVGPDPGDGRPAPPRRDWIVRPTPAGRRAQEVWEPLAGIIEDRWRARFGAGAITALRDALQALLNQPGAGAGLPRYLPVVRHQMFADVAGFRDRPPASATTDSCGSPRDWGRTRTGGGRGALTCGTPMPCSATRAARCPATPWCCTAADGPMAADRSREADGPTAAAQQTRERMTA